MNKGEKEKFNAQDWLKSLKESPEISPKLQRFLSAEKNYQTDNSKQDVIRNLMQTTIKTGGYIEILLLLEKQHGRSEEKMLIFEVLEKIFVRLREDLRQFSDAGVIILQHLFKTCSKSLYSVLGNKHSRCVKRALKFLTAAALLNREAAKDILANFEFLHPSVLKLPFKVDITKTEDVKTCYTKFVLSFLFSEDIKVICKLLELKEPLQRLLNSLMSDKGATILLILSSILEKVIKEKSIPKTLKVQLLDGHSLYNIAMLYGWMGPKAMFENRQQRKKNEKKVSTKSRIKPIKDEDLSEDQIEVVEAAHQFLIETCSGTRGIKFQDDSLGTGTKNCNHLLTILLGYFEKPYTSSRSRELFIKILSSSPDQLRYYIPTLESAVVPRDSELWTVVMNFVTEIYDSLNYEQFFERLGTNVTESKLFLLMTIVFIPKVISRDVVTQALQNESPKVNNVMLNYLNHLVQRISKFYTFMQNGAWGNKKLDIQVVMERFANVLAKQIIPEAEIMNELWEKSKGRKFGVEELELIIDIQMTLKQLFPTIFESWDVDLVELLNQRTEVCTNLKPEETARFQLKLMELLLKFNKDQVICAETISILFGLMEKKYKCKESAAQLLTKILSASQLFNTDDEIDIWIAYFCNTKCKNKLLLDFLQTCISELMSAGKDTNFTTCMVLPALHVLKGNKEIRKDNNFQKYFSRVLRDVYHLESQKAEIDKYFDKHKKRLPEKFQKYFEICLLNGAPKNLPKTDTSNGAGVVQSLQQLLEYRDVQFVHLPLANVTEQFNNLNTFEKRNVLSQITFCLNIVLSEEFPNQHEIVEYCLTVLSNIIFPVDETFQSELCAVVVNSPHFQKYYLNCPTTEISNLIIDFIIRVRNRVDNVNYLGWYVERTASFIENLPSFNKVVNKKMKEVIQLFFQNITDADIIHLFEKMSKEDFLRFSWLTKMFCKRVSLLISESSVPCISNECLKNILELINNSKIADGIFQLLKAWPVYCYQFNPGVMKECLNSHNQSAKEALILSLNHNAGLRNEFEQLCLKGELKTSNHENVYALLKGYLQYTYTVFEKLSSNIQSSITGNISSIINTLEEDGILNFTEETVNIYLMLINLNVKDWDDIRLKVNPDLIDVSDIEILKNLYLHCNKQKIWESLLAKCFSLVEKEITIKLMEAFLLITEKVENPSKCSSVDWMTLIKKLLQISLSDSTSKHSELFLQLLQKCRVELDYVMIFELILGHSNFMPLMIEKNTDLIHKDILVDILIKLTALDPKIVSSSHIPLFLASYNGTLYKTDQKLLYLMHFYSVNGANLEEYKPFIYGRPAVNYYSLFKKMAFTLNKIPPVENVLNYIDKELLTETALLFPINLEMEPKVCESLSDNTILDPRFLLPLLSNLLSPSSFVNCSKFLGTNVLPVVFASLSSNCSDMRQAGYYILMLFLEHLEGGRFRQKTIWIHLINTIKNSITEENMRMSNVITVYFGKVFEVLLDVGHPLYQVISSFLLLKSNLNLHQVPDFLKLFNSTDLKHTKHRKWVMQLLVDGLKDSKDYYMCEKYHLWKNIMSYVDSSLCDDPTRLRILHVYLVLAGIPTGARRLVENMSFLAHLHTLLLKFGTSKPHVLTAIVRVVNKLWFSFLKSKNFTLSEMSIDVKASGDVRYLTREILLEFYLICNICVNLIGDNLILSDWKINLSTISSINNYIETTVTLDEDIVNAAISESEIGSFLRVQYEIMENATGINCFDDATESKRFRRHEVIIDNQAISKVLLFSASRLLDVNNSRSLLQTCLKVVDCIFSTIKDQTKGFQIKFFTFIHKLLTSKVDDEETVAQFLLSSNDHAEKIFASLLQCYCSGQTQTDITLLSELNKVVGDLLREARNNLSTIIDENCRNDKMWIKAIDHFIELSKQEELSASFTTQSNLSILSCEFLVRKSCPFQFAHLISSPNSKSLKRKRKEVSNDSEIKHKRKRMVNGNL